MKVPLGLQGDICHILIIRWDAKLGDSFVSSFFFREIKKLPNIKLTVITTPGLELLYRNYFGVDDVISLEKRPGYYKLRKIASKINDVDLVIHFTEGMKMKDLYFLHKLVPNNVASLDDGVARVNIKLAAATKNLSFQEKYSYLLTLLGVDEINSQYIIPNTSSDRQSTDADRYVVINPFGSSRHKSIAPKKMVALLAELGHAFPEQRFGVLSSPATRDEAKEMVEGCGASNIVLIDAVHTIDDAIHSIRLANAVISVDTAIVHIAVGLYKPLVAIYPRYGDEFNQWLPSPSPLTRVLFSHCPGLNADMNRVKNDEVVDALSTLISVETSR
ncbi:glycosyltransferase family 9 protein [Aeromonas encheleia]